MAKENCYDGHKYENEISLVKEEEKVAEGRVKVI